MKHDEKIVGVASRIEFEEHSGKLYLVFEIVDEKQKQEIKQTWTQDLEFKIIGRNLVEE